MKKRILTLCLAMLLLAACAAAEVTGINVLGVYHDAAEPALHVAVRAIDGAGDGEQVEFTDLAFSETASGVELTAQAGPSAQIGHIVVVDTSLYYYGNQNITAEDIRSIVGAYISRVPKDERVMFVLATDNDAPTMTGYMDASAASGYASSIELTGKKSAKINSAIYAAFEAAAAPQSGSPMFNSVFIVCDPDLDSNDKDNRHSLSECASLRNSASVRFDVMMAVPRREKHLADTTPDRRNALNSNMASLRSFAVDQCGGNYCEPAHDKGVDLNTLHAEIAKKIGTVRYAIVNYTPLAGYLDKGATSIAMIVGCMADGNAVARTVTVPIDEKRLPEVVFTPEVNYTPAPTPVVVVGDMDGEAMQAVRALKKLGYLEESTEEFDNICFQAYLDFCELNSFSPEMDGIYEAAFNLLLSDKAIPAPQITPEPTPTPQPTPTPAPTLPPDGYSINDADTLTSGGFIAKMQSILKELNCYPEGVQANVGRMDQATLDALATYCAHYGWTNNRANGIDRVIAEDILENGQNREPIVPPEPTTGEKVKAFLARELTVAGITIPMLVPVAACFVLFFLIMVLIIVLGGKGKKPPKPEPGKGDDWLDDDDDPDRRGKNSGGNGGSTGGFTGGNGGGGITGPLHVTFIVSYNGNVRDVPAQLRPDGPRYTIGRKGCDLLLDGEDHTVSRRQAEVFIAGNSVCLLDMGSVNPTLINGSPAQSRSMNGVPINRGDTLTMGAHTIRVMW